MTSIHGDADSVTVCISLWTRAVMCRCLLGRLLYRFAVLPVSVFARRETERVYLAAT